jgi:hypothetical protein
MTCQPQRLVCILNRSVSHKTRFRATLCNHNLLSKVVMTPKCYLVHNACSPTAAKHHIQSADMLTPVNQNLLLILLLPPLPRLPVLTPISTAAPCPLLRIRTGVATASPTETRVPRRPAKFSPHRTPAPIPEDSRLWFWRGRQGREGFLTRRGSWFPCAWGRLVRRRGRAAYPGRPWLLRLLLSGQSRECRCRCDRAGRCASVRVRAGRGPRGEGHD